MRSLTSFFLLVLVLVLTACTAQAMNVEPTANVAVTVPNAEPVIIDTGPNAWFQTNDFQYVEYDYGDHSLPTSTFTLSDHYNERIEKLLRRYPATDLGSVNRYTLAYLGHLCDNFGHDNATIGDLAVTG